MSAKSLKDIVEEGFSKLNALSEKRKVIIERCQESSGGVDGPQAKMGMQKLEATESAYVLEMNTQLDRSQTLLQQTLNQLLEDNERYIAGVKENLNLKISKILKDIAFKKEWQAASALSRLDSTFAPMEREVELSKAELRFQALSLLGELESACKRNQSGLHEKQAEIVASLSASEHELTGSLSKELGSRIQEAQKRGEQVGESLRTLYKEQAEELSKLSENMDSRISLAVSKSHDSIKQLGKESEQTLEQVKSDLVSTAASEIVSSSQESFSELESSYEFSHQELTEKLSEMRGQTERLLEQVKQFLKDVEEGVRSSAENIAKEAKEKPLALSADSMSLRNPVEETMRQLTRDADATVVDFKRQLGDLLRMQSEKLSNLCSSTEEAFSAACLSLNTELKELNKVHEQSWSDKEQELLSRLQKLEKETKETFALVNDDISESNENGSNDGSVKK